MMGSSYFKSGLFGMGDLVTESYENCDPRDVACVSRNAARGVAKEQQNEINRADVARAACEHDAALNPTLPNNCDAWWPQGYAGMIPAPNVQQFYSPQVYAESFLSPVQAVENLYSANENGGFTYHTPITQIETAKAITNTGNKVSGSQIFINALQKLNANNSSNLNMPNPAGLLDSFMVGVKSVVSPGDWGSVISSGDLLAIAGLAIPALVGIKLLMGGRR